MNKVVEECQRLRPHYHSDSATDQARRQMLDHFESKFKGDNVFTSPDPIVERNRQLLLDRSNVGLKKYGMTIADNPSGLRGWLNHALEETLDKANYLQAAMCKIDEILAAFDGDVTPDQVSQLKELLNGQC